MTTHPTTQAGPSAERIEHALASAGLDALLAASTENAIWLSGAYNPVRRLIPERPAIVLWPAKGTPVLIAAAIEGAFLRERSAIVDIRLYDGMIQAAVSALAGALRDRGFVAGRLGLDFQNISAPLDRELGQQLPDAEIVDATDLLDELRAIKTEQEVTALRRAALATDRAEWAALDAFRLGWTEAELGIRLRQALIAEGADTIAHLVLGGGVRGVAAHAEPQDVALNSGDLLRFDMGGLFKGWYTDIAKTAVVGEPSARQRDVYRSLRLVLDRHIERLRPGAGAGDVYAAVVDDARQNGLDFRGPHVGHGIGLGIHEWPILHPRSSATIQVGMVLCAEVTYIEETREQYHLEELVWIRDDGAEVLSRSRAAPAELPVIG